jgi:hypothetical protein
LDRSVSAPAAAGLVVAVGMAIILGLYALSLRRVVRRAEGDRDGDPLLAPLTEEVRKWRAEANHWRVTAERLQAELDGRPAASAGDAGPPE